MIKLGVTICYPFYLRAPQGLQDTITPSLFIIIISWKSIFSLESLKIWFLTVTQGFLLGKVSKSPKRYQKYLIRERRVAASITIPPFLPY